MFSHTHGSALGVEECGAGNWARNRVTWPTLLLTLVHLFWLKDSRELRWGNKGWFKDIMCRNFYIYSYAERSFNLSYIRTRQLYVNIYNRYCNHLKSTYLFDFIYNWSISCLSYSGTFLWYFILKRRFFMENHL